MRRWKRRWESEVYLGCKCPQVAVHGQAAECSPCLSSSEKWHDLYSWIGIQAWNTPRSYGVVCSMDRTARMCNYSLQRHDHEFGTVHSDAAARILLPSLIRPSCGHHRITNKATSHSFARSSIECLGNYENGTCAANQFGLPYIVACSLFYDRTPTS
jgi:hypothetical protein